MYHSFRLRSGSLVIAAIVCIMYLAVTRTIAPVYDPVWIAIGGFRDGYPSLGILGTVLASILIPGMFCWMLNPRQAPLYLIAAVSCLLWIAVSSCMRVLVFA